MSASERREVGFNNDSSSTTTTTLRLRPPATPECIPSPLGSHVAIMTETSPRTRTVRSNSTTLFNVPRPVPSIRSTLTSSPASADDYIPLTSRKKNASLETLRELKVLLSENNFDEEYTDLIQTCLDQLIIIEQLIGDGQNPFRDFAELRLQAIEDLSQLNEKISSLKEQTDNSTDTYALSIHSISKGAIKLIELTEKLEFFAINIAKMQLFLTNVDTQITELLKDKNIPKKLNEMLSVLQRYTPLYQPFVITIQNKKALLEHEQELAKYAEYKYIFDVTIPRTTDLVHDFNIESKQKASAVSSTTAFKAETPRIKPRHAHAPHSPRLYARSASPRSIGRHVLSPRGLTGSR